MPTIADLRAKRLELMRAALREAILAGGLDRYRVAVESLAQEHDLMDIALAAVKVLHQKEGGDEAEEEEEDFAPPERFERKGKDRGDRRREDRRDRPRRDERTAGREERAAERERPRSSEERGERDDHSSRPAAGRATARIYVGAGRKWGIRPQDLVGAIAGESGIPGNQIGAIEIADKYSIVELPEGVLDQVVKAMRKSVIKGRKAVVRRFVEKS